MPPLLSLSDITYSLGGRPLLDGAALAVEPGERLCLVGRNGSGKSTMLKIAAGQLEADSGIRFLQPGTTVQYLPQEPDLSGFATTRDYVLDGLGEADSPARGEALLGLLGLTGAESPANLSGGEARRAALARALAPEPDLLLLDEPTNHLDLPAIEWLEGELASMRCAMVLISHDRRLLEKLARGIVWLDRGRTRRLERGFAAFEAWREEVEAQEERDAHKLDRQIAREEDWMRYGVTARRKRNVRRVAELAELRQKRREAVRTGSASAMSASDGGTSGKLVAVAEGLAKSYGDQVIVRDLDLRLLRGDRLGVVGANGAGKSTLLRLLTGVEAPDQGRVTIGSALQTVTLDQQRRTLDPGATLADTLTGGGGDMVQVGDEKRHVIGYMKDFLFRPEQARTPVGVLSGGERGRLMLACALARPSNLLVLDEPTNDLDLETLDLLQEMLAAYAGTVLVVSHDRDFLDRVATSVLVAEGDGRWIEYAGGYSDMLAQRRAAPAAREARSEAKAGRGGAGGTTAAGRAKLSFKDKHALETLPKQIEALTAQIEALRATLADPGLYGRDAGAFARSSAALEQAEAAREAAEERWLELEIQRESLG